MARADRVGEVTTGGAAGASIARRVAARGSMSSGQIAKRSVQVKPATAKPAAKPAAKPSTGDLSSRGARPTAAERINRARDIQWNKAEKAYDAQNERMYTGLKGGPDATQQFAKGKNAAHRQAIAKEASKKLPIKINSNPVTNHQPRVGGHAK